MRTITLKIAAGSNEQIGVKGDYVRVKFAPYDVLIENSKTGEIVEASQGDDFEFSPFNELRVTNLGGVDSIFKLTIATGKKAGASPGKIDGYVQVVDGGKSRTSGNGAFLAQGYQVQVVSKFATIQLWNPVASGKNIFIESIIVASNTTGAWYAQGSSVQLLNAGNMGASKKVGGAASVAQVRTDSVSALVMANFMINDYFSSTLSRVINFHEPVQVPPGFGFNLGTQVIGSADLLANFEYFEDVI